MHEAAAVVAAGLMAVSGSDTGAHGGAERHPGSERKPATGQQRLLT
jgi:hypothetical protein